MGALNSFMHGVIFFVANVFWIHDTFEDILGIKMNSKIF